MAVDPVCCSSKATRSPQVMAFALTQRPLASSAKQSLGNDFLARWTLRGAFVPAARLSDAAHAQCRLLASPTKATYMIPKVKPLLKC